MIVKVCGCGGDDEGSCNGDRERDKGRRITNAAASGAGIGASLVLPSAASVAWRGAGISTIIENENRCFLLKLAVGRTLQAGVLAYMRSRLLKLLSLLMPV